ncbi:hypothetical protein Bca4012_026656 [Brassica carinata]
MMMRNLNKTQGLCNGGENGGHSTWLIRGTAPATDQFLQGWPSPVFKVRSTISDRYPNSSGSICLTPKGLSNLGPAPPFPEAPPCPSLDDPT